MFLAQPSRDCFASAREQFTFSSKVLLDVYEPKVRSRSHVIPCTIMTRKLEYKQLQATIRELCKSSTMQGAVLYLMLIDPWGTILVVLEVLVMIAGALAIQVKHVLDFRLNLSGTSVHALGP